MFPKEILEILIPEYINMSDHIADGEMNIEIRIKLGEILVKTTRSLGMQIFLLSFLLCGISVNPFLVHNINSSVQDH